MPTSRPSHSSPSSRAASAQPRTPVDWTEVRERLGAAVAAVQAGDTGSEKAGVVLARRAAALARPLASDAPAADTLEVVAFELDGQALALEAKHVRETVLPREMTRLPGLPEFVRGVANVRSRVVAAVDLRPLLQLAPASETEGEKLLIVEFEGAEFGVLADRVIGLRALTGALRRDVPGLNDKYLRGLAADGTIVLDLAALFPDLLIEAQANS